MTTGSCKFGLWRVEVSYASNLIYRVRFVRDAPEGPVPMAFRLYLAGMASSFSPLSTIATADNEGPYAEIYRAIMQIPYGETRTYGQIAEICGTHRIVVNNAISRNPTPLIVPCHRVVAATGLGSFCADLELKRDLLALETRVVNKRKAA
ncbi:MAG TPA: MGMT family protein [Methanocorpusculum sp.]|nr:MGMT family protein [Methanocorpusculum sp.]